MMVTRILALAAWAAPAISLPQLVALGGIALVVAMVLAFILTVLFEPVEYDDVVSRSPRHGARLES
jgi:hypothetical protein